MVKKNKHLYTLTENKSEEKMKNIDIKSHILFEDNHIIIIDKPAGISVEKNKYEPEGLQDHIKKYLKDRYNKKGNAFVGIAGSSAA